MNINEIEEQLGKSLQIATALAKKGTLLQEKEKREFVEKTRKQLTEQKETIKKNKEKLSKEQFGKIMVDVVTLTFMLNTLQGKRFSAQFHAQEAVKKMYQKQEGKKYKN